MLARYGLLALLLAAATSGATAQTILGLGTVTGPNFRNAPVGAQGLVEIDATNGSALNLAPVTITGIAAGQTLVGIDYRPATPTVLYALGYDAATAGANTELYVLNTGTNALTSQGPAQRLELGGATERIGFDFNPVADRIRVTSTNRNNYRLLPTTGALAGTDTPLAYAPTPAGAGLPGISGVAYTNAFTGASTTALYDIDFRNNGYLAVQNPPNGGTLTGAVPLTFNGQPVANVTSVGLDIYFDPATASNTGYVTEVTLRPNGAYASNTYRLNLATGVATLLGNTVPGSLVVNFEVRDLAVAPSPPPPTITWTGTLSDDWRTPGNWSPARVPSLANKVVVPGGTLFQPAIATPQQSADFTLGPGATLTTNPGGTLVVGGNWANNGGSLLGSGDGGVLFNLNTDQTLGGPSPTIFQNLSIGTSGSLSGTGVILQANASVRRVLTLFGNLTTTGQVLTLLSDANNSAMVVHINNAIFNGQITGPATVQRYIETSRNPGLGYRHYAPPVSGSTVNDLTTTGFAPVVNPAYNTSPNTAGNIPSPFPTVYSYDQSRVTTPGNALVDFDAGWLSPTTLGDALAPTLSYTVNISGAAAQVDFVGTVLNGPISTPALPRGGQPQSGYHLRGNPYAAPLDWQLMVDNGRLPGLDPALYVFKSSGQYTGSYASYVGGIGANGGTRLLAVAQGFFVRTLPGQSGQINFTNAERATTYASPLFQRGAADARPQLTLALQSATASLQTVVYFEAGATPGYDLGRDAAYLPAPNGLLLATETGADAQALSINGLPALAGQDVALPLRLAAAGTSPLTLAVDGLRNLPAGYRAYLRDARTGHLTDLAATASVSVQPEPGRYSLLFRRSTATPAPASVEVVNVYPNPAHGTASLLLPDALRTGQPTQILDNLGRVVRTQPVAAGAIELPLAGLAPGLYTVQVGTTAGLVSRKLVVE